MDMLLQDVRYAIRGFAKAPGFVAVVLLTVGLGTGANATVFSFVNALLLRPVPGVSDPGSLVAVYTSDFSSGPYGDSSYPDYLSIKSEAQAFTSLAAYQQASPVLLRLGDTVERVRPARVSGEFFEVLRLRPIAGRLLGPADTNPAAAPAAVLAFDFWKRTFAADPSAVGSSVVINGQAISIVGVLPERFDGLELGSRIDIWMPLAPDGESRDSRFLSIVGRLRPGVTLREAQTQVTAIAARLATAYPETNRGILGHPDQPRPMVVLRQTRLHPAFREREAGTIATIMMAAVALVLLIACANIASLLLSRATARAREIAIRRALGAGRKRLIVQMLTESMLLGAAGAALGLLFALWTADALPSFFTPEQARLLDASVDGHVLTYTLALAFAASLLFGAAPALVALRPTAAAALRGDAGRIGDSRGGSHLRNALVVVQVALAMVLLVSAALLVRSVANALTGDLGFDTRNAVVANVELAPALPADRGMAYFSEALGRVRAIPGVTSAAVAELAPLGGGGRRGFRMQGYTRRQGEDTEFPFNSVDADYFATMRIPVIAGRVFDEHDTAVSLRVAVVNETLARRYFGGNPVGRYLTDSGNHVLTIIGVVKSGKYRSVQEPDVPYVYYPLAQSYTPRVVILAATAGDPRPLTDTIRRGLADLNRDAAIYRVTTLSGHLSEALAGDRLTAALVGSCGALALVLALVGIYGVVSCAVGRRSREIGIRVALGARPSQVLRLVLGDGLRVIGVGTALGVAIAAGATRLLESLLFGIAPSDTTTFVIVPATLVVIALMAALLPAKRSLALDPVAVLRQE